MSTKIIIAATVAALSLATTAFAGEANYEPFPLSVTLNATTGQTQVSMLPVTAGLPAGALDGTPAYEQAQSVNRWYAQQADHRFAQQQAGQTRHNG